MNLGQSTESFPAVEEFCLVVPGENRCERVAGGEWVSSTTAENHGVFRRSTVEVGRTEPVQLRQPAFSLFRTRWLLSSFEPHYGFEGARS